MFCQDWGSLIGLHVAGMNPDWFARIVVGDGALVVIPEDQFLPPVLFPNVIDYRAESLFADIPPQQEPFYDEEGNLLDPSRSTADNPLVFYEWMNYAMKAASFRPSEVLEAMTWFDLPADEEAAYDAPFPCRKYLAGARVFPSLVRDLPGANDEAWAGLMAYEGPFLTIWASNDPGQLGTPEAQQVFIDNVPGAAGQPHTRLPEASHFLQDDQGPEIARLMLEFIANNPR
jgi:haloalkane dehalogenase